MFRPGDVLGRDRVAVRIDRGATEHDVELFLEHFIDGWLHEEGSLMRLLEIEAHNPIQEDLKQPVSPDHTQRLVEPIGCQFRALVRLKAHQFLLREVLEHAACRSSTDANPCSHVTRVGLLAMVGQEQNRM